MIIRVESDDEIMDCFKVLSELRPQLQKQGFVNLVRQMFTHGYRLVSAIEDNKVAAVAGYKISSNFVMGKKLYIEDLVTSQDAQSKGFGDKLFAHIETLAKKEGCSIVHLDSGIQRHRAHKFYFKNDMEIFAYNFVKRI